MVRNAVSIVAVLLLAVPSKAGIRPSFMLEYLAWHASDIVVASEGEKTDGTVTVLAVWKGGLVVGDTLSIPELLAFASQESRTVTKLGPTVDDGPPLVVSPTRMVLFLKRARQDTGTDEEAGHTVWRPASFFGGMQVAVAWIAQKRVYVYAQVCNPGPTILTEHMHTEAEMRIEVERIAAEHGLLRRIAALRDSTARARQAAKHVDSICYHAKKEAFSILGGCGEAALPPLRQLLKDDHKVSLHSRAVKTLAAAGGEAVAAELTEMVEDELRFWKETAPGLQYGWWNGRGLEWVQVWPLRDRYRIVLQAVYALKEIGSPECRDAVTRFRDYWQSLPQLQDGVGRQMSQACDAVLRALPHDSEAVEPSRPIGRGR